MDMMLVRKQEKDIRKLRMMLIELGKNIREIKQKEKDREKRDVNVGKKKIKNVNAVIVKKKRNLVELMKNGKRNIKNGNANMEDPLALLLGIFIVNIVKELLDQIGLLRRRKRQVLTLLPTR